MKKHIANIITVFRILSSILMLFFPALSVEFNIFYLLCGLSDMIDGTIARKTNTATKFGAKLDTLADLVFVISASFKLLPIIPISKFLWIWIILIAVIKTVNIILYFCKTKSLISNHALLNKITGLLLFLLPLSLKFSLFQCLAAIVCSFATFAAIQESFYVSESLF